MDKRIFICGGIILLLALIGFVLYNNLEIYEKTVNTDPSDEVNANYYYAIEQWLKETEHPVRFEKNFNMEKLAAVEEKVVIIHTAASRWDNAEKFIIPWIKQGGYLLICMDYYTDSLDEELSDFFSGLEITVLENSPDLEESPDLEDSPDLETVQKDDIPPKEPIPTLGRNVCFLYGNKYEVFDIKDNFGYTRLVEFYIGKGAITITGRPNFMNNIFLKEEINAKFAWSLTGARADGINPGVLFVRERYLPKSMFGKIMERGNLLPVAVSAFLLIIFGFWMVIPIFGLTAVEKQRTSRPIEERFTAEIRFLKKYRSLDHYLDVYEREQNPSNVSENKKTYNYRELINQYRRIFNGTAKF